MIEDFFVDTIAVLPTSRNEYGDITYSSGAVNYKGRFQDHIATEYVDGKEILTTDSVVHLPSNATVQENDLLLYDDNVYRVKKKVTARRGGETNAMFIKLYVEKSVKIAGIS